MKASEIYARRKNFVLKHLPCMNTCDVTDSRPFGGWIKRRRLDRESGKRYITYEVYEEELIRILENYESFDKHHELLDFINKLKILVGQV